MKEFLEVYGTRLAIFSTLTLIFITYIYQKLNYWKRKNVPFHRFTNPFNRYLFGKEAYICAKAEGHKIFGLYAFIRPCILIRDLDLLKRVFTTDFHHFESRGFCYNEKDDPLSAHLFSIYGSKWRKLRTKLTPTFTSGKMKLMFNFVKDCADNLVDYIEKTVDEEGGFDCKDTMGSFSADVIGSCAFGLQCDSLKNPEAPFRKIGQKIFNQGANIILKFQFTKLFPSLARMLHIKYTLSEASDFYFNTVKQTIDYREKKNVTRNDFLQLLIEMKNHKDIDQRITFEELAAQCYVFFLAGFETSSSLMTFCLYELAINPQIQENLRKEIETVLRKHGGELSYEAVNEMKYLHCVLDGNLSIILNHNAVIL